MEKLGVNTTWLIAQIINFGILLFLLWLLAYRPILNMLNTRKQKIQDSLAYAERVKQESAEQQKVFERKLDEARRESKNAATAAALAGEKAREAIIAQAHEDAQKIIQQAKEQIEYERKQMLLELRDQVIQLSLLATQKVVSTSLDDRVHRQLISDFIAHTDMLSGKD